VTALAICDVLDDSVCVRDGLAGWGGVRPTPLISLYNSRFDAPNQRSSQRFGAAHGDARRRPDHRPLCSHGECVERLKAPHSKFVGGRFDPFRSVMTSVDLYCEKGARAVPSRSMPAHGREFATILVTKTFARRSQSRWWRDDRATGVAAAQKPHAVCLGCTKRAVTGTRSTGRQNSPIRQRPKSRTLNLGVGGSNPSERANKIGHF
jgi:hypothetical protein